MSKAGKIFAIVLGSAAVILLGSGALLAWTVVTHGVVRIAVDDRESGTRFDVPLPAALLEAGIGMACMAGAPGESHAWRHRHAVYDGMEIEDIQPAVLGFLEGLADAPDAVLVEVRDGEDWVRIVKSGRDFQILVESPDANVRLSMPAHLLHRIVRAAA